MKRSKYKPLLSKGSITKLKFIRLNGCEVRKNNECKVVTNIVLLTSEPMQLLVGIWLFTNLQDKTNYRYIIDPYDEINYLNRVIDMIVNKVLEENPSLKVARLRKSQDIRHRGEFGATIDFKKKFFLRRLFSKKKQPLNAQ